MNTLTETTAEGLQKIEAEMFSRWEKYIDAEPKTVETYTRAIRQFAYYLRDNGIARPTREDVIAFRNDLLDSGHKATTVTNYLAAVKQFFKWADQAGLYPDIAAHVKAPHISTGHKKDALSATQACDVLAEIDLSSLEGLRDYAMLSVMVTTGLRTVSIVKANVGDIGTSSGTTVLYYQGKGRDEKAAYVKLAAPVEKAVRTYMKKRGKLDDGSPLFVSVSNHNAGERMTTRSISRIAKNRLVSAGLISSRLTAHSLRHTAATLNLLNGGTIEETKQLLDHRSINTTMIYVHELERANNKSENRITTAIFG